MKKKYLVTGGTGFIGSNIVKKLLLLGNDVKIIDNNSRGKLSNLKNYFKHIEIIKGEIQNEDLLLKESKKVDCLIHLAAINGTGNFYKYPNKVLDVGIKGVLSVVNAVKINRIKEVFFSSSSEVYQTPAKIPTPETVELKVPNIFNPRYSYGASKIISEIILTQYLKNLVKRLIIFRPHNIYGPNMGNDHVVPQFINQAKKILISKNKKNIFQIQGSGNQTRAFLYIDDFIDGFICLLNKSKGINVYNIGSNDEIFIKNLAKKIITFLDLKVEIKNTNLKEGSPIRRCPDISKIKLLGFQPRITLDEGLKKLLC
jgi:nucleoside-diphosphate-sugar epimerase